MPWIVIVLACFAGAALGHDVFGAFVGAALAWLLVRSLAQQQQIRRLQDALTRRPDAASMKSGRHDVATDSFVPTPAPPTGPSNSPGTQAAAPGVSAGAPSRAVPRGPDPRAAPRGLGRFDRARAWLLGGNTIARAGIGILFIGLAFLAKYASDHALLPVEFRLAGIAVVALMLMGVGWRLRTSRPAYAQVLQGGAVAVMYLTLFLAFRHFGVISAKPAFVLMVLVAGLAAALAVLQDARVLAIIGALGGFATPLLVSGGNGDHVGLFSYDLVLDLGIAGVAWFRNWRSLNAVGFLFTFGVGAVWGVLKYEPDDYLAAQGFLVAYFVLFNAVLIMPTRRLATATSRSDAWVNGGLLFGLPTLAFVLQCGLVRGTAYGTALSALVLAAFYVLLATRLRKNRAPAVLFDATLAIATVFISLVIPFALDASSTGGAWALEGAGLLWLGFRQQRRASRLFGYAMLFVAGITLGMAYVWQSAPTAMFNAWFFNVLLLAVGALAGAFFVHRGTAGHECMPGEASGEALLIGWGLLWALGAAAVEIDLFATARESVTAWLVVLSTITLVCTLVAPCLRWTRLGAPLMALAPALLLLAGASVVLLDNPMQQGGWWAWPIMLGLQGLVLRRLAPGWAAGSRHAVHAIGPLVLAVLGAQWGGDITRSWGDTSTAWPWLGTVAIPATLLLWLPRAATATRWPVSAEPAAYQVSAGAVLTVALLLWTLLANGWSTGSAHPLPHVPLLNPLDLGVATALLAAWMWLRRPVGRERLAGAGRTPLAVLTSVAFFWINAMLLRAFHAWGGVPYRLDAWMQSLSVQTGVTMLWSTIALALMWASARRADRTPWVAGAALLATVVAKMLLVDLSGTGTVTRIVSFIGVGLLMLVIAYVAPLPSSEKAREAP